MKLDTDLEFTCHAVRIEKVGNGFVVQTGYRHDSDNKLIADTMDDAFSLIKKYWKPEEN